MISKMIQGEIKMGKRYVLKQERGCGTGCFSIFGFIILGSVLISIAPFLLAIVAVVAVVWAIMYFPKYKTNRERRQREDDLAERERRLDYERRKRDIERREDAMYSEHSHEHHHQCEQRKTVEPVQHHEDNDDIWSDF